RDSSESESASYGISVEVGDGSGISASGQAGAEVGGLARKPSKLAAELRRACDEAYQRARLGAREKALLLKVLRPEMARNLHSPSSDQTPSASIRDEVEAVFKRDPRALATGELKRLTLDASRSVRGLGSEIAFNVVAAMTELRHEIFV